MLNKAIIIATKAHDGQADKAGEPYILHPLRVMLSLKSQNERVCGVLHDVIEDTNITFEYLTREGFSYEIIEALNALTKKENENYDDFINRVLENKLACHVKLADLEDNMDLSRIENPNEKDFKRVEKYKRAKEKIREYLNDDKTIL